LESVSEDSRFTIEASPKANFTGIYASYAYDDAKYKSSNFLFYSIMITPSVIKA
jgi:hypothetical protein